MLQPMSGRSRPQNAVATRSKTKVAQPLQARPQRIPRQEVARFALPTLRSAHSWIFAPVMRAAGGVMDWRLQRDGFVVRDIAVPGGCVRVWDAHGQGPGPCVIFVHGLGGASCEYRDTLVWLKTKCRRVMALDMPSHGGSTPMEAAGPPSAERRRGVIDAFQARINLALDAVLDEPANLIGHSLGGYAVMRYSLEGAARTHVRGLGLVSPDGAPWTAQELADDRALFDVKSYAQASDIATRTYPQHRMRAALITPFVLARFATPQMRYLNHSDVKQPALTPAQLGALPGRVRLVFGQQERFDPPHNLTYFCAHMPATMTLLQPNTGHGDIIDAHPAVLATLEDFLV